MAQVKTSFKVKLIKQTSKENESKSLASNMYKEKSQRKLYQATSFSFVKHRHDISCSWRKGWEFANITSQVQVLKECKCCKY